MSGMSGTAINATRDGLFSALQHSPAESLIYFLCLPVCIIACGRRPDSRFTFFVVASLSLVSFSLNLTTLTGFIFSLLMATSCYIHFQPIRAHRYFKQKSINAHSLKPGYIALLRPLNTALMIALAIALVAHILPGFPRWEPFPPMSLSVQSLEFQLKLSFDTALVAICLLCFGQMQNQRRRIPFERRFILVVSLVTLSVLSTLGYFLGLVIWDYKLSPVLPIWLAKNLLLTCIAEEAFFRGIVQFEIQDRLKHKSYGSILSLGMTSVLFGLAHFAGGPGYMLLASIAGFAYGYVYQKTGRIEASIALHLFVNLFHFVFLSYPMLVPEETL
ncbi:MAG: CPBP family intramembrane metalloprotease [Pseudomonadales bacterium]|nr:CPBP family intramembrane metalloprotease [Pseudomonadales bacterium]